MNLNHSLRPDDSSESHTPRKLSEIMQEMDWLKSHLPQESVGAYLRNQLVTDPQETQPLPSDFKTLSAEKQQKVFPLTDNPNTSNAVERAVQYYLQANGISLPTAVELGLGCASFTVERDSPKRDANGQPVKEKVRVPFLAYPFPGQTH